MRNLAVDVIIRSFLFVSATFIWHNFGTSNNNEVYRLQVTSKHPSWVPAAIRSARGPFCSQNKITHVRFSYLGWVSRHDSVHTILVTAIRVCSAFCNVAGARSCMANEVRSAKFARMVLHRSLTRRTLSVLGWSTLRTIYLRT